MIFFKEVKRMPARQTYQTHRYAVRPSDHAPPTRQTRLALLRQKRAAEKIDRRKIQTTVTKGFISDLRSLARQWLDRAVRLEHEAGAKLLTDAAARKARIDTYRLAGKALRDLIDSEGV